MSENGGRRVMRVALPVELIRRMDDLISSGRDGFETRTEFIEDAIGERLLELSHESADPEPTGPRQSQKSTGTSVHQGDVFAQTRLGSTAAVVLVSSSDDLSRPGSGPLFGLHNKDYPTLWGLERLASMTTSTYVDMESFLEGATQQAWEFAGTLRQLEELTGKRLTALFPTNPEKRKVSEARFQNFALGEYRVGSDGTYVTGGPIFSWSAVGLVPGGAGPFVGLTEVGLKLLVGLEGMGAEEPHERHHADHFLQHLRDHARADWLGFEAALSAVGQAGATRSDVLEVFGARWPDWTDNEVSSNAAGYIARAREWGLIEPRQRKSRYYLTEYGMSLLNELKEEKGNSAHDD